MNQLLRSAQVRFGVRYDYSNPLDRQRAQSLSLVAWGALVIVLFYLALYLLGAVGFSVTAEGVISFAAVFIGIGVVLVLLNQGNLTWASTIFVFLLYLAAVAIMVRYLPSLAGVNLLALSMPVVAGGLLLNCRGASISVALVLLTLVLLKLADWLGVTASIMVEPVSSIQDLSFSVTAVLVDGLLLVILAGGQRQLLQRNLTLSRELRSSVTLTRTLAGSLSIDDLLLRASEMIRDELGYYHVQVFLVEEGTSLLQLRSSTSVSTTAAKARRPLDPNAANAFGDALRTEQPVIVSLADPETRRSEFLGMTRAQMVVPLVSSGRPLGILDVQRNDAAAFTDTEIEMLQTSAAQLALAIQNAEISAELQAAHKERDQLTAHLREMDRRIDQLGQETGEKSWGRYLQAKGTEVVGLDWHDGIFTPSSAPLPDLDRIVNSAMPEIRAEGEEQILSIPIVLRGQVLGAMEFRAPVQQPWNNRSLELARIVAQRVALALDNIRLYEQAQTVARREQLVSRIAAQLQSKTDIDSLMLAAAEVFQDALGATRATIRLSVSEPRAAAGANGEEA